jgi:hypothetical protein
MYDQVPLKDWRIQVFLRGDIWLNPVKKETWD